MPDGRSLPGYPATSDSNQDVILAQSVGEPERLLNECLVCFEWEVHLKRPSIHGDVPAARHEPHTSNGRFPFARVIISSAFYHPSLQAPSHIMLRTPEALAVAPCGDVWRPHRLSTCVASRAPTWSWATSRAQRIPQCAPVGVAASSLLSSRATRPGTRYANDRASETTCSLLRRLCPH